MRLWLGRIVKGLGALVAALVLVACGLQVANGGRGELPGRAEGTLRVATLNVHYIRLGSAEGPWSVADWERRKLPLSDAVAAISPDLMAFQEMESFGRGDTAGVNLTLDHLLKTLPDLRAAAVGDPESFPITQPILYRAGRLEPVEQGWFFFPTRRT